MTRGAGVVLALLFAMSCGGPAGASPSPSADETSPPFTQLLLVSKVGQYQVTMKPTSSVQGGGTIGEQTWYFKQGRARFDFVAIAAGQTTSVSVFDLPSGIFSCAGGAAQMRCSAISGSDPGPWLDPPAFYQAALAGHPAQFAGVSVGIRHIGDEHGHCYDIHPVAGFAALPDGHFCYTVEGIPLALRVTEQTGQWSFEATTVVRNVPDSVFTLPAAPTPGAP